MAEKIVIEAEVKSNIGDVSKDAKNAAGEFKVMGVSLNGVKAGFVSAGKSAKLMFGSIKAGLISTGIGAFVVLIGSLLTFFTKTKKGAELLEVAFAGIGAAINVITDRVSKFGGAIVKLFSGDVKGALTDVKGAFTGIGTEIANDTTQAIALTQALQNLTDSQRELNVETAQRRADIEELKLIAEDVTKTEKERLEAAEKAFKIENDLLENRIANAEEAVRIQKVQNGLNESMDEDLDALAQKEIELANIRGESVTKQIELNNKINAIEASTEAKRLEAHEIRMKQIQDVKDAQLKVAEAQEAAEVNRADGWEKRAKKEMAIAKAVEDYKLATISKGLGAAATMAGENLALSKGVAAAQTIFQTQQGIMAAMGATSVGDKLLPYPLRLANAIATGIMGAQALSKIMSTSPTGAGAGAGGGGGGSVAAPSTPAPQMMSGAFDISGGVAPEAMKAFVVTDEMSNSQNQLANIRRRATI